MANLQSELTEAFLQVLEHYCGTPIKISDSEFIKSCLVSAIVRHNANGDQRLEDAGGSLQLGAEANTQILAQRSPIDFLKQLQKTNPNIETARGTEENGVLELRDVYRED